MDYVITADEMKRADAATMETFHVPSVVLMERAALRVYETVREITPHPVRALIVCGTGNNGGDGMALARMMHLAKDETDLVVLGDRSKASSEARRQIRILEAYGVPILTQIPEREYDWVIDAIFGISLSRDVGGIYADAVRKMNALSGRKLAVDISSGISADTGKVMGVAFRADHTVTMAYAKYGQMLYPGKEYTGRLHIAQIGITKESFCNDLPKGCFYDKSDLSRIPARQKNSNKGTYGKLLSITGSENMAGASFLASSAAYRVGAGLVYIETPEANRQIMQTLLPEAVLYSYWNGLTLQAAEHAQTMTAVICGCGLGMKDDSRSIVENLLRDADKPLVLDADALNLIAAYERIRNLAVSYRGPLILTPHAGEAARLLNTAIPQIKDDPIGSAKALSSAFGCITVLKDAVTVVTDADQVFINTSGTNAMAKGGSGDVLTGIIGGLLSQHADPWTAATVGVYLHGLAGEAAAEQTGSYSMLGRDLTDGITAVLSGDYSG